MKVPYYAVIFTSVLNSASEGYSEMADKLEELLKSSPGYLGMDSVRNNSEDAKGITVSYWKDLESIKIWKNNETHLKAQEKGKKEWYKNYSVKICRVEKEY